MSTPYINAVLQGSSDLELHVFCKQRGHFTAQIRDTSRSLANQCLYQTSAPSTILAIEALDAQIEQLLTELYD